MQHIGHALSDTMSLGSDNFFFAVNKIQFQVLKAQDPNQFTELFGFAEFPWNSAGPI